jgi:plastocyanin
MTAMARSFTFPALTLAALACSLILAAVACGDARSPSTSVPDAAAAAPATTGGSAPVVIQLFQFRPSPLEVGAGALVSWVNRDEILHTVTAGAPGAIDGRFSGTLDGRDSAYQFTFAEPGTYAYFCARHESMRGEVLVR